MLAGISNEQSRQLIDVEQVFSAYRDAEHELRYRYSGAMIWRKIKGREYLYRKLKGSWKSLGPRGPETEKTYQSFIKGREEQRERKGGTQVRLDEMARVNKALRLGRVPIIAARIIRRLDKVGLLGRNVIIVGTNAMYAYEAAAAVQLPSDLLATGDVDLLFDVRRRLDLATDEPKSLVGLLQKVDRSFSSKRGSICATNKDGYRVDLIAPVRGMALPEPQTIGGDGDLTAAEIEGLVWLENTPKFERVVIGEDGYPLRMVVPDPRVFAAHKFWMAERSDRGPVKRGRDHAQAGAALDMASRLPNMELESRDLESLPMALRRTLLDRAA